MLRTNARRVPIQLAVTLLLCSRIPAQQRTPVPPEFVDWLPISAAEQQAKSAVVDPTAGAEVLTWRVHVVDELLSNSDLQRVLYHYVRLKIFDEKGAEKAATIDLTYGDRNAILEVSGRTVKADGSIVELDRKTVYKRDLVRAGGRKLKAVSFAMPAVEPGAILEYRWEERQDDNRIMYFRMHFQREFPVRRVTYFVKPLPRQYSGGYSMYLHHFNCQTSPLKPENDGYTSTYVENVPAARDEPFSPSEPNISPWALLHYQEGDRRDPDKYWADVGRKEYNELKQALKVGDEIKSAASEAGSGAKNDDEKIAALIQAVRAHVRNLYGEGVTDAERERLIKSRPKDRPRTAAEIFKSRLGSSNEMNVVFNAMAQEAGLDARPALVADRNELFNTKYTVDSYFLDNIDTAVKRGDSWKIYDVNARLLPPGMLPWREEGMSALITDPKSPSFIETSFAPPEASAEIRTTKLTLSQEGTLEGDVEERYTGHRGEEYRSQMERQSPAQREEWLRDRINRMFPDAEVTGLKLENVDDAATQLRAAYHLKAPHFAQVTGKRILFQPNAFRRAQVSPFSAAERKNIVNFPYAWQEVDQVSIQLPEGWKLDNAGNPGPLEFGKPGAYNLRIGISKTNELVTSREFSFGREGIVVFAANVYPTLKKIFDEVQLRDSHTLSIIKEDR
jgi:Domain of Unknown Function with PDB structure (DUF3857)